MYGKEFSIFQNILDFVYQKKTNKIAIIDIETTGLRPDNGLIVEIGIVELDLGNGTTKVLLNSLIKEFQFGREHKNAWIFNNSDLKFEEVENAPSLKHLKSRIQLILNQYSLTSYNTAFDFGFMESRGFKIRKDLPDIMAVAKDVCKIIRSNGKYITPNVQEAWDILFPKTNYKEKHRAVDDAIHEATILFEMYKRGEYLVESR